MTSQRTSFRSCLEGQADDVGRRLVRLAHQSLAYQQQAEKLDDLHRDVSRHLPSLAVLSLEGDTEALDHFLRHLQRLAQERRAIDRPIVRNQLDDSFCLRSVVAAYHELVNAGLVEDKVQQQLASWLYEVALCSVDGRVRARPGFEQWHLRNQNVPATMVYLIAHLLDQTLPAQFDTRQLWSWSDAQIVGWDLTWRDPDDSWLYQFIWTWSAFIHARLRRPDLLISDHARRSFDFYLHLSLPGGGQGMVFGDADPGDLLGAAVALMLGARLFRDGRYLFLALRYLDEVERRGMHQNLADRGPEMFNLYHWWPRDLEPVSEVERTSMLMQSPLPGRGWSFGSPEYAHRIKTTDRRFPYYGQNTDNWDAIYQVQDPKAYALDKPDKMIFVDSDQPGSLFSVMDLRSHGLHDHADALNIVTLTADDCAWLIETAYTPRDQNSLRWMHNVPLVLAGRHSPDHLRSWRTDTWREVNPGDCTMQVHDGVVHAQAWLRHDNFDYVDFASDQFDVQRSVIYRPDDSLLVVDRLVARRDGHATAGQVWHSPASMQIGEGRVVLEQSGKRLYMDTVQSHPGQFEMTQREPLDGVLNGRSDPFYFRADRSTNVLLWHWQGHMQAGQELVMAARFSRRSAGISLQRQGDQWLVGTDVRALGESSKRQSTLIQDFQV